jgi:lysozyme family protein
MTDTKKLDAIIDVILKNEGGFVNIKEDRGGPTNYGVIQSEYSRYLGRPASIEDVRKMPIAHARDIFKKKYYFAPKINLLPETLQPVVTDASVLYGPKRAIIFLQKVLNQLDSSSGLGLDGDIGPATTVAANKQAVLLGADKIINAYVDERIRFCEAIVANRPSQRIFIKGWTNRANSFRPKKR